MINEDFQNWWAWYQHNYPDSPLTQEQALEAYNAHYSCTCESCNYRKEHGAMPIRTDHPGCTAPLNQLVLP
jgi:hypothetical protein